MIALWRGDGQNNAVTMSERVSGINMNKIHVLLAFCLTPLIVLAGEAIQIGTVLQHAVEYHLRIIHLHGVVSEVHRIENTPSYKYGGGCAGAYAFTLRDNSGGIAVEMRTTCGDSQDAPPEVKDGQTIGIDARIEAPGYYTGQGRPLGEQVTSARAVALRIYLE